MHDRPTTNSTRPIRRWTRRTHRLLGLSACVFLFLIGLTGITLNHADLLGLSGRSAASSLVIRLYDMQAPHIDAAFNAGGHFFASAAQSLFADGVEIASDSAALVGALEIGDEILLASSNEVLLLNSEARLIERASLPPDERISRLGMADNRPIVLLGKRSLVFDLVTMQPDRQSLIDHARWSMPVEPTKAQQALVDTAALGQSLTWARLVTDIHSGRILPGAGKYLVDLATVCLLYLCVTGLVLGLRKRRP